MADLASAPGTDAQSHPQPEADEDLSDLDDLADEDDSALAALQNARLAELRAAAASSATAAYSTAQSPFAAVHAYDSEKDAMTAIAGAPLAVLLFTHRDFAVCETMAGHLGRVAGLAAREATAVSAAEEEDDHRTDAENVIWLSLEAERAPFLAERLRIRVLPCVVAYRRGEEAGRLVGFEGLGKGGLRPGGWKRVAAVLRSWGILGRGKLAGEDDEDEDGGESGEEEGSAGDIDLPSRRDNSWVGGYRMNSKISTKGTSRARDIEDDDWD